MKLLPKNNEIYYKKGGIAGIYLYIDTTKLVYCNDGICLYHNFLDHSFDSHIRSSYIPNALYYSLMSYKRLLLKYINKKVRYNF